MKSLLKVFIILALPGFSSSSLAIDNDNDTSFAPIKKRSIFKFNSA
ncbi:hypothetical protein [Arsenophonus sp. PmNCSU2021_1]